jgi:DNA polymerase-3 subunit alpha
MIHLHLHSVYSLLDGLIKFKDLAVYCKDNDQSAVACTDHGSIAGLVEFHKEMRKEGIKPILGYEAYYERGDKENLYHLILLARNEEGYRNLVSLNNLAYGNFYKKPRINDEMLQEHGRGLIAMTACLQGYFQKTVLAGRPDLVWLESMGHWCDSVFIELQNHGIPDELKMIEWAMSTDNPCEDLLVGTTDAHYIKAEHKTAHEVALAVSMNKKWGDYKFSGDGYYLHDPDLPGRTLSRTYEVADLVEEYEIGHSTWVLPKIDDIDYEDERMELAFNLGDYLFKEYGKEDGDYRKAYEDRLDYEFEVVKKSGFIPYLKMVSDICRYVDEDLKSTRGWGRGSAGGSLVVMLYGITKIDPIKYGTYFERFINPDRVVPPDIDLDFRPEDRQAVIEYMRKKYGKVYQIGTYTTLGSKEVINAVCRATGYDSMGLQDFVPIEAPVPTIKELMDKKESFWMYVTSNDLEDLVNICMTLEGCPRNPSAHASGVVLDIYDEIPIRIARSGVNAGTPVTAYDMYSLEDLHLTKFDILGVNMLSVIDRTIKSLDSSNLRSVSDIPLDDQKTFERFNDGNTLGVFQFETHAFKDIIKRVHPDSFDELVDLNTLGRPGCLDSGMTEEYISRKHLLSDMDPLWPGFELGHKNLPLFQEDIMKIAHELAGFTLSETDTLRKAIGKKIKETMDSLKVKFIEGCHTVSNMPLDTAEDLWATIEKSARYTWNLSHAVCYTLISYWCMYLSAHYPVEFFCELLNGAGNVSDSSLRRRLILSECRRRSIPIKYPDINKSGIGYSVEGGFIRLGLSGIKYCGDVALRAIMENRPYKNSIELQDKCGKKSVNKKTLDYLLMAGVFLDEHVPVREEEIDALGYSVSERYIDRFPYCFMPDAGEILDVTNITTKKGDPMAFVMVEFKDKAQSITVFPKLYSQYRNILVKGNVFGWVLAPNSDILAAVFDVGDIKEYVVEIPPDKMQEFMTFYSSCTGIPNIRVEGYGIASVPMSVEMLQLIHADFGIVSIHHRKPSTEGLY